jgi:hypothetical protein
LADPAECAPQKAAMFERWQPTVGAVRLLRLRLPNRATSRLGTVVARCPQASAKEPQLR